LWLVPDLADKNFILFIDPDLVFQFVGYLAGEYRLACQKILHYLKDSAPGFCKILKFYRQGKGTIGPK